MRCSLAAGSGSAGRMTTMPSPSSPRHTDAWRIVLTLVIALAAGITVHALAVIVDGRHVYGGPDGNFHYNAVLWLDRLIGSPQEALGWGAGLLAAGVLLRRERRGERA